MNYTIKKCLNLGLTIPTGNNLYNSEPWYLFAKGQLLPVLKMEQGGREIFNRIIRDSDDENDLLRQVIFLSKSSCVTAFAAEFFYGLSGTEAFADSFGSWFVQNLIHGFPEEITQCKIAFMIQAAGDYRAVAQYTDLIPQTVAEYLLAAVGSG